MKHTILETIEAIKTQKYELEQIINDKKPKRMSYKDSIGYEVNKATAEAGLRQIEYVLHLLENTDFTGENVEKVKLTDETKEMFTYVKERVEANIEEIITNIKLEYDEQIKIHPNAFDKGEILCADLTLKPIVFKVTIPVKFEKL